MTQNEDVKEVSRQITIGGKPAVAQISTWKDKKYFSVRMLYKDEESGEMKFSKNGISIPVEGAGDLLQAVVDLFREGLGVAYNLEEVDRVQE